MKDSSQKPTNISLSSNQLSQDERLNSLLTGMVGQVKSYANQLMSQIKRLSNIGRALSGETDLNTLLEMIVDEVRKFTYADAGTLYILEDNVLKFMIVQNDTLNIRMGGASGEDISFDPVELKETNVSAFVAIKGVPVNIPDVYDTDLFDFTGPKKFDLANGYRSKSMLVVPMRNHENDVIGVLQLMNAVNKDNNEVIPFSPDYEHLTESLASQAAIAITNVKLINDMERLFESFVQVMATAIDEKSPVTGGHIRRVANLTMVMAETLNESAEGTFKNTKFTREELHQLRVAAWMHDIGKVTTPVEVIEKAKKLQTIFDRIHLVDLRMQYLIQRAQLEGFKKVTVALQNGASPEEVQMIKEDNAAEENKFKEIRSFIQMCNEPTEFLDEAIVQRLQEIARMTYVDIDGNTKNYLDDDELENLSIRRGSITERERKIMQNHADVTLRMLNKIPFTKKLKDIPNFAGAHHECINGQGYPLGLKGDEIPFEGKLMAVTDIAEALTATDRPYKKAMPLDNVYRILRAMVQDGNLDHDLVEFFINEKIYERYLEIHEKDQERTTLENGEEVRPEDIRFDSYRPSY